MTAEPSTLTIRDNPAREFRVSNESDIIAVIEIEYRGGGWWRASFSEGAPDGNPYFVSRSLADVQRWAATAIEEQADEARATCKRETCHTDGEDTSGYGSFACGVLSPHGISVSVLDGDGNDITQDYLINGM